MGVFTIGLIRKDDAVSLPPQDHYNNLFVVVIAVWGRVQGGRSGKPNIFFFTERTILFSGVFLLLSPLVNDSHTTRISPWLSTGLSRRRQFDLLPAYRRFSRVSDERNGYISV